MSPERTGPQWANGFSSESTNEQVGFEQEYDDRAEKKNAQFNDDPDVVLDVPVLKVDEIDLEVEDLRAQVSLRAELVGLVNVSVGVDVYLGKVKLGIKGVEAQALLKVRLDRILSTLDRALDTIDRNPQILGGDVRGTGQAAGGESQAAQDTGQSMERAAQLEGAAAQAGGATERADGALGRVADEAEQAAGGVFDETVDEAGRTVQRAVDESGNITETILNESGDVVDETVTSNLADLQIEEEYVDDRGRIVGRARDVSGNVVEEVLDEEGNVLDLNVPEEEDREPDDGDPSKVDATDAARRKADELGVKLSEIKGTGSGGRILVKDVEKAAKQSAVDSA